MDEAQSGSRLLKGKKLKLMLAEATQQMYRRNLELADANKLLSLLRSIDSLVLASHEDLDTLCQSIANTVIASTDFSLVGLLTNHEDKSRLDLAALATATPIDAGLVPAFFDNEGFLSWLESVDEERVVRLNKGRHGMLAKAMGLTTKKLEAVIEATLIKTIMCVKLTARGRLVGIMVFGVGVEEITEKQMLLIDRLGEAVGIAMDNKLLLEENQRVVKQLQRTNDKLKQLNETKDDFIGMASHQLRTPLTSVKGYLSLVIDGDAGRVNETQKKLLTQAFVSSQRMVYLIADLLNVSRLRTGKFVIERAPTNVADMISDEIGQLREMASSRGVDLDYKPPAKFPSLPLDETKTRQVVMNFIDNAVYYTPTGGHIRVEVKELPKSIELRVIDDGIGVPKQEHHHLFTKFYRAKNAQRARPDGTGLGLFMAKKVIIAQGGALIFNSVEGKGSTFGFSFPKDLPTKTATVSAKTAAVA